MMGRHTSSPMLLVVLLLTLLSAAHAQFFNFFNQGGGPGGGHPREQEAPPSGDASWFEARTNAATCPNYLCPRTLACVPAPNLCPCPFPQQKRCPYPDPISGKLEDGGGFCVQEDSCEGVLLARGSWWELQKLDEGFMKAVRAA